MLAMSIACFKFINKFYAMTLRYQFSGGPTCIVVAFKCTDIKVTICDINQNWVDAWMSDKLHIYEPGLDKIISAYW